jgi:CubicO group peptidase (beta-lactamase class C family)
MHDTGFRLPEEKRARLAQLYSPRGTEFGWDRAWAFSEEQRLEVADPEFSRAYHEGGVFESGGAGLASTIDDYYRFAQMLANGGELDGVRILAPGTVALMRRDHLGSMDRSGLWSMDGFGLGVGIVVDMAGKSGELGADGAYGWGGAAGTNFWIDPDSGVVGVFMVQSIPHQTTLSGRFRVLTYQALLE